MITIIGPKSLSIPSAMGGNDLTFGLTLVASTRGLVVEPIGGNKFQIANITDTQLFTLPLVKQLVSLGCEVLGYRVYFEFTDPKAPCPLAPGKIWADAFGELHKPVPIAGRWFQANEMNNDKENDGEPLPASQWINSTVTLRTLEEVNALRPQIPFLDPVL